MMKPPIEGNGSDSIQQSVDIKTYMGR